MLAFQSLLVEGIAGIGKSTLIDALIRRHVSSTEPRRVRTFVHLAQTHTYGPLARPEDAGTLTAAQNVRHLERIVDHFEWLESATREHDKPMCFVLVDTLHLTHCVRPGVVQWSDVESIDSRLGAIGCRLLMLTGSQEAIARRAVGDRIGSGFLTYLSKKVGGRDVGAYLIEEQRRLVELFDRSVMPKLSLENDGDVESVLDMPFLSS